MPKKKESRVPKVERGVSTFVDWEAAHIFLQIARHSSFRSAAADTEQPVNTLRRKLENLERQLGSILLTRHIDGVRLTEEGRRVAVAAARMEAEAAKLRQTNAGAKTSGWSRHGPVKEKQRKSSGDTEALQVTATRLDWESAHIFLEVARHKSFRRTSAVLNQAVNVLRRRCAHFESQFEKPLLTRHADGVRLTESGQRAFNVVGCMELEAFGLVRAAASTEQRAQGAVKLAISEGLASFWIAPRLAAFSRDNPDILVDLRASTILADVLRLQADVAVQLVRPTQKDLRVLKLGRLHAMPYAAQSYIKQNGMPKTRDELRRQTFVLQATEHLLPLEEHVEQLSGKIERISVRSNMSVAHYFAIAAGAGIGMLPTYATALGAPVTPIDVDFRAYHDIWLVYHADANRIPRARRLIDWLIESFSPQRYPWFGDEFVHPKDFPESRESAFSELIRQAYPD